MARGWLEHLSERCIQDWSDLRRTFIGNFQGTYTRPGNSWDVKNCKQAVGESLRDYIQRFSCKRNELPEVSDADVINAFTSSTTSEALVHKLGHRNPRTAHELLDIATTFTTGEEAVQANFDRRKAEERADPTEKLGPIINPTDKPTAQTLQDPRRDLTGPAPEHQVAI